MTVLGLAIILGIITISIFIIDSMIRPQIEWFITYDVHIPWISDAAKPLSWILATLEYILIISIIALIFAGLSWLVTVGNTIVLW